MKRTYSKEYKIKACQLVVEDGIKAKVVAEKERDFSRSFLVCSVSVHAGDRINKCVVLARA